MLELEVKKRDAKENPVKLRKDGLVPAVYYGRKEKSTPISISQKVFLKIWKQAGESSIISLTGDAKDVQVLIQDVDRDPVTGLPIHADFYAIEKDKKLKVKIPIEFTGVSPAIKDLGGILVKVLHEIEVESLPKDLPHGVSVDIKALAELTSQILAKDIALPHGVELVTLPLEVVAAITVAKDEPEEPAAPIDLSTIEVEKKGKEAKEGEEGTDDASAAPAEKPAGKK